MRRNDKFNRRWVILTESIASDRQRGRRRALRNLMNPFDHFYRIEFSPVAARLDSEPVGRG